MLKFHSDIASANCPRCSTCLEQFPGMKLHCDTECQRCSRNMVQMVIVILNFCMHGNLTKTANLNVLLISFILSSIQQLSPCDHFYTV